MGIFDKIKKKFGAGSDKPEQAEVRKTEPVKKTASTNAPVVMTKEQKELVENMMSDLTWFLMLLRLDMLVLFGVYCLNLDPDNDETFVDLGGFGTDMPARTLYGAYMDIDRRMAGDWSFVKDRCEKKMQKFSPIAKMPPMEISKWEEIRKTVLRDMLKDTKDSTAPIIFDRGDKKLFYAICNNICTAKLQQLQSEMR